VISGLEWNVPFAYRRRALLSATRVGQPDIKVEVDCVLDPNNHLAERITKLPHRHRDSRTGDGAIRRLDGNVGAGSIRALSQDPLLRGSQCEDHEDLYLKPNCRVFISLTATADE
jgi:hypothetical protein